MSDAVELVIFKTNPGVSAADFLAADEPINTWVQTQPGFRYRSLSLDTEQGGDQLQWRDIVYWDCLANAKRASEAFMATHCNGDFMAMIDGQTVSLSHSEVQHMAMGDCGS
ncbi:hypothetical protein L1F30_17065 [Simiduia sp. 21SJ11W-1]|uniref:hypothetical protein n=1 Tax=Simiduia sp. 21SJ11W-1 TaxID=2909669 RepID=UPI0020A0F24E|nr:hypothetical protein [Simiduia sp. 21SJ11W-1]UTA47852.1 hypothetical protein L1F30_17065 [Simiduia sp. 21SJ11W-1]